MTLPTSSPAAGTKRAYRPDDSVEVPDTKSEIDHDASSQGQTSSSAVTSAFRNVSACNRCRVRKNRCDQRLPACSSCEKAGTRCVGFDPITKKEIPRSYVYFLETRLSYLESLLVENKITFEVADAFEGASTGDHENRLSHKTPRGLKTEEDVLRAASDYNTKGDEDTKGQEDENINKIVSDIGMVSVHGASDRRYLGTTSGISFARVVLSAIKHSVPNTGNERNGRRAGRLPPKQTKGEGDSMRDSYFGLSNRPNMREAPFPDHDLGLKLVTLYFEHANPQIPILHRVEFMELFDRAYAIGHSDCTSQELYLLNIVFAIGAGVIFGSSGPDTNLDQPDDTPAKRARFSGLQAQPEEYHASAMAHLSSFFNSSSTVEGPERAGGDLEDLQAILLLAGFALLRPVAPGLWYIVGVAMRLAIDLGLHFEDGLNLDGSVSQSSEAAQKVRRSLDPQERGRREWVRDMRRRLWWCTYCFDRLVSTCVGRPFGITDSVVTTEFPSLLDDRYITKDGLVQIIPSGEPTYKHVAYHYLRLRLLQSEILQVLQHQQAQQARSQGALQGNEFVHTDNPSPFLVRFRDFRSWRSDVDQRLWEWKESAPSKAETGVAFSPQFLELNYWQAVIMLYRNSLSVPELFAGEVSPTEEVSTPTSPPAEEKDDQDLVFLKCAEAGQKTLKLYRQLHRRRLVNYTYLATHHLFMAGISFLYAVWHSPVVRTNLTLDDFDFTVLAATSVLGDLMEKCPPAKACRDAFERMSKATVQMCMTTPGFKLGHSSETSSDPSPVPSSHADMMLVDPPRQRKRSVVGKQANRRPPPQFDLDLHELFPDDLDAVNRPSKVLGRKHIRLQDSKSSRQPYASHARRYQTTSVPEHNDTVHYRTNSMGSSVPTQLQSHMSPNSARPETSTSSNAQSYFNMNQNSYNPDFMSNIPGMEFLDNLGSNAMTRGSVNTGNPSTNQMQAEQLSPVGSITSQSPNLGFNSEGLMDSPSGMRWENFDNSFAPTSTAGFDFGVGMGLDFSAQTSWTNPQGAFDLDGFFFGGGTMGNVTDSNFNVDAINQDNEARLRQEGTPRSCYVCGGLDHDSRCDHHQPS